jgi:hypothetical protein
MSTCVKCRYRPACGRSYRNAEPTAHSFTGSGPSCSRCSMKARIRPAVSSGRSVSERPPRSSKVYISFVTTSVDSPTPREKTAVSSNTGVST